MSVDPAKVAQHVELDTPGGTVYALIEDWVWPGRERTSKVLTLQPANGSGEPGGQACVPERHPLNVPLVDKLIARHPELEPLVAEARLVQPEPAAPPSVADLSRQVAELTALLQGRGATAASGPDTPPGPDVVAAAASAAARQVLAELRAAAQPAAAPTS